MRIATFGLVVVLAAAPALGGGDAATKALDDAKVLANKGDALKAAERYGEAIALAQSAGDLQAEQTAAESLEEWFDALPAEPSGQTKDTPGRGAVLASLLRKLDANRCGAFVSAPIVARNILARATESGDLSNVADAAKVAAAHATKATSGRAAAVVAKYAEGLKAMSEKRFADATAPLESAATDAVKASWLDLATHATTELAVAWLRAGAPDKAAAAVAATASALDPSCGPMLVSDWQSMLQRRAADAPESLAKRVKDLMARMTGSSAGGAGGAGGHGGAGAPGGRVQVSPIGKLLPKWPKGKPIVSATRTAKGFEPHWVTAPNEKPVAAFDENGVQYQDDGGVWLGLLGRGVALLMVDPVGNRGGLGGKFRLSDVRACYLLAEGETWNVAKDGVVTITR